MTGDETVPIATVPGDYPDFYRRMTACLRGEGPAPVDPRDSLAALEVIEQISGY